MLVSVQVREQVCVSDGVGWGLWVLVVEAEPEDVRLQVGVLVAV